MSLLLALLDEAAARTLEPGREIWVAIRTDQLIPKADGTAGSGTQADPYDGSTPDRFDAAMRGIQLNRCAEAIVENNLLLDIADVDGLRYANCGSVKAFNNQTATGQLRRAYDPSTTRYQQELQDFAEDTLLPV